MRELGFAAAAMGPWRRWRLLVVLVAVAALHCISGDIDYKQCRLGKAKLYNCRGKKYDLGQGKADLEKITTPQRYIIKLKENLPPLKVDEICAEAEFGGKYSGYCIHKYKKIWLGMLMVMGGADLTQLVAAESSSVDYMEVEGTFRINDANVTTVPWGLDRIDHLPKQKLLNNLFNVTATGKGVHVYVLDTGIRCTHEDFQYRDGRVDYLGKKLSRCSGGFDGIGDGLSTSDCNGHGTHCAGIVAGLKSGVAKDSLVHPVRAMGCDGSGSYGVIMAALDWLSMNAIQPAVLSMSVVTQASISIDQAVQNLVENHGIMIVAASGNFLQSACNYSPSRAASVLSVAASNIANMMSWFSNHGSCTSLFAPGELIPSAYNTSDTSMATLSGTSMACPHVAGTAALYLETNADARPSDVRQAIIDAAEPNAIANVNPDTTMKLLNTNLRQPPVNIQPRSIYNASEGMTYPVVISLKLKSRYTVYAKPYFVDAKIGYFRPRQLVFPTSTSWSIPQIINIVLHKNPDFLDHQSLIEWNFISRDPRFVLSPEGYIVSLDKDVCKKSSSNPCGQTAENPKIIPSLPFYYVDNSELYENMYDENFDGCHSSGPDVVFQYTATNDTVVDISLCGTDTEFDSILSVYQSTVTTLGRPPVLTQIGCNDDACSVQSYLSEVPLRKGQIYIFMVDGYGGNSGPFDISITSSTDPSTIAARNIITSATRRVTSSSLSEASSLWVSKSYSSTDQLPNQSKSTTFQWTLVSWDKCDKDCGGGIQYANLKCYQGDRVVANHKCAGLPYPNISRVCNRVACLTHKLYEGPWRECNQSCGSGIQKREAICINNLGQTADLSKCGGVGRFDVERVCNTHPCDMTHWEVPRWNFCNKPCSSGKAYRESICLSNGVVVDDENCFGNPPASEKECNTQPCQTYAWLVGPWDGCPDECNSVASRQVECVDGLGLPVNNDSLCNLTLKPEKFMHCQQPEHCRSCGPSKCNGNGECVNGECLCSSEWEGIECERLKVCQGRPLGYHSNGRAGCCASMAVDINQLCCASPSAKLDKHGNCCESGKVDACGMCNGHATSNDVQGQCCSTLRDAKGVCCKSGLLDECHICDGDGISCATNFTLATYLGNDKSKLPLIASYQWKTFIAAIVAHVANLLVVDPEAIILDAVQLNDIFIGNCDDDPDPSDGCSKVGVSEVIGLFNFTVLPIPSKTLNLMNIRKEDLISALTRPEIFVTTKEIHALKVKYVSGVRRAPICGNGMCESGERCNSDGRSDSPDDPSCCLEDCPYVLSSCPIPLAGPRAMDVCSGNGICLDASGQCQCFPGYSGSDCYQCAAGWSQIANGSCMRVDRKLAASLKLPVGYQGSKYRLPMQTNRHRTPDIAATAATFGLVCVVCVAVYVVKRRRCQQPNDELDEYDVDSGEEVGQFLKMQQLVERRKLLRTEGTSSQEWPCVEEERPE